MYFTHKTAEAVKAELKSSIDEIRAELNAWESVIIEKKKDGGEMAQLGRAIKGAQLSTQYPAHDIAHPVLYVYFKVGAKYCNNYISAYFTCEDLPDKGASRETVFKGSYYKPTTPMTAQELREHIQKHCEELKKRVESYEKQIKICDKTFTTYRKAIEKAEAQLKTACASANREGAPSYELNSLYYEITRTV